MKALVCTQVGEQHKLEYLDWPDPVPGEGEVLVRIHAAGVNYPDLMLLAGTYQRKPEVPFIPGLEASGEVVACGPGTGRLKPGDRVMYQDNAVMGGFAEMVALPEESLTVVPAEVDFATAASVPVAYGTSEFALVHRGRLQKGEVLVVHGATGGVGLAAVQIGKRIGATVIATGGDDAKLEKVRASGADHVVNLSRQDLRETILELTGGRGADVYYDPVGGEVFEQSMRAIARYGRILIIGAVSGRYAHARTNILLIKGVSVIGAGYGSWLRDQPADARAVLSRILDQIVAGQIKPNVHKTFPLERGEDGLAEVADRRVVGKVVLVNGPV